MIDNPNVILLGFGHRARSGKDTTANLLKEKLDNVKIIHWADGVYEECENKESDEPLILQEFITPSKTYYSVLHDSETDSRIAISNVKDPFLHKIFTERGITKYEKMTGKDPEILQFWGTNFRRTFCDKNYWINKTLDKIKELVDNFEFNDKKLFILIPDTRFKNEADTIREKGGFYIKVIRTNKDGTLYLANDRDNAHSSEIDLEQYAPDYTLKAYDVQELKEQVDQFYESFLKPLEGS